MTDIAASRALLCWVVVLAAGLLSAVIARAEPPASETLVLLTFDVEADQDEILIHELSIGGPASYFVTGQFAEKHPQFVAALARGNTLGSHSYSHPDLTTLSPDQLRAELLLSKMILEKIAGRPIEWFRAPYFAVNEKVMATAREVGYRYDSSVGERWRQETPLSNYPIVSVNSNEVATDYDLFEQRRLTDAAALNWLKALFAERTLTGQPLTILLHPRIIVQHATVLRDFVAHVRAHGGVLLSLDQYREKATGIRPTRTGVWVDFSNGPHDPNQVVQDVLAAHITDVFLMAKDPEGDWYADPATPGAGSDLFGSTLRALRAAGVRVHAWVPINSDSKTARLHPDWAMADSNGKPSTQWLSPTHPEARRYVLDTIATVLDRYPVDGIHLDYIRYPGLEFDFSDGVVRGFLKAARLPEEARKDLLSKHYNQWTDWRAEQITLLVHDIRVLIDRKRRDAVLSAALIADAATSYRGMEEFGQNYGALGRSLELVVPMAYFEEEKRPVEWISEVVRAARYQIGTRPLLVGLEAYQEPGKWTLDDDLFARSIEAATTGANGIVFYPYLYLFGRSGTGSDMPGGSAELATRMIKVSESTGTDDAHP
jgi:peptidoglycan/xylan/chitin deacetylase (PgdA/CDA1 family)